MKAWIDCAKTRKGCIIRRTGAAVKVAARRSGPPPVGAPKAMASRPSRILSEPCSGYPYDRGGEVIALERYQQTGKNCHINAVAIAGLLLKRPLPEAFHQFVVGSSDHPLFSDLVEFFRRCGRRGPYRLEREKWPAGMGYREVLESSTSGVYVLLYGDHAVAWDTQRDLVYDTDPQHPLPLDALAEGTHQVLGLPPKHILDLFRVELSRQFSPAAWASPLAAKWVGLWSDRSKNRRQRLGHRQCEATAARDRKFDLSANRQCH